MNGDPQAGSWPFDPESEPYVSLATLRRDGREVLTPVWIVGIGGQAYVYSAGHAGKVKRLRREHRARMAACTWRGEVHGDWVAVQARQVDEEALRTQVFREFRRKYGWQIAMATLLARISGQARKRVVLEFELAVLSPTDC